MAVATGMATAFTLLPARTVAATSRPSVKNSARIKPVGHNRGPHFRVRPLRPQCRRGLSTTAQASRSGASASGEEHGQPPNTLLIPLQYYKVSQNHLGALPPPSGRRGAYCIGGDVRARIAFPTPLETPSCRSLMHHTNVRMQVLGVESASNRDLIERGYRLVRVLGVLPPAGGIGVERRRSPRSAGTGNEHRRRAHAGICKRHLP